MNKNKFNQRFSNLGNLNAGREQSPLNASKDNEPQSEVPQNECINIPMQIDGLERRIEVIAEKVLELTKLELENEIRINSNQ
jgi:hypothetical protein